MNCKFLKVEREVSTFSFGDVVQLFSLPGKKIGLLNNRGQILVYDLYKVKLDKVNLKTKVFHIHPYSQNQIILLSYQNKAAEMFNLKTQQKYHITNIPSNKVGDNFKDSTIFFQTKVKVFRQTGHICFLEYIEHQTNLIVMLKGQFTSKKFPLHNTNTIIEDYNEKSKLVVYKQDIEKNQPWTFKIIDIQNNFEETEINFDLKHIYDQYQNSLVTAVKELSQQEILFFVNNQEPGLWIYNITANNYQKIQIQIESGLEEIIALNRQKGWLIISYVGKDQQERTIIDWINIKERKLIGRLKQDTNNLITGWQNDYFINQKVEDQANKKFWFKYLVHKSSLIMQLLMKSNMMSRYGNTLCRKVIQLIN